MEPLTNGDYPESMRSRVWDRIPTFTKEESEMVKGSFDYLGLNYYTTYYVRDVPLANYFVVSYTMDSLTEATRKIFPIYPCPIHIILILLFSPF